MTNMETPPSTTLRERDDSIVRVPFRSRVRVLKRVI